MREIEWVVKASYSNLQHVLRPFPRDFMLISVIYALKMCEGEEESSKAVVV